MAKLICFFGGDSQTGTTLLSEAVSMSLAERGRRVLLILASGEQDEGYLPRPSAGLDTLLRISRLIREDVKNCVAQAKGFDYIAGSSDMLKKQFFDPELIRAVRGFADRDYDFIICDGGHDATLPLPISCLTAAERRFYVLTGGVKCVTRFGETFRTVIRALGLDMAGDAIVLNMARSLPSCYSLSDLSSAFGLPGFSVPWHENGQIYEFSGSCAYKKEASYTAAVDLIASAIEEGAR